MLKIGLFGYGKMGRAIESLAAEHGATVVWRVTRENRAEVTPALLRQADVIIEFTRPESAFDNVMQCLRAGVPVVSGTTGWLERLPEAQEFCEKNEGALLWASNFSIGVNLFFALNTCLSKMMNERPEYTPAVTEIHHIHKLDAPSGTALTLVQGMVEQVRRLSGWALSPPMPAPGEIPVSAIREGEVPGTHIVAWAGPADEIKIEHRAHSRLGFASGALLAAQWLADKQGFFSMRDVLGIEE
ncbi:MAG: 4-hydroxy-tetrahydrodipicolinate reductase [Saprospiraceae bacterium]|nr:4-hydroxy-tetrahydrodipicolinate reductase [Saprospiraceae bacterium]